jgi:acetyl esterase/lipase
VRGSPRLLELDGYGGSPLPCVLWELEETAGSALVLPGGARAGNRLGGTPARPDVHWTRALLLELGLSVLEVWWDTDHAPRDAQDAWLEASVRAGAAAAAEAAPLRVLVGRSFGTVGVAKLVLRGQPAGALTIWIAPLLGVDEVRQALGEAAPSAFVVAGTADELVDEAAAAALALRGATLALVEGGDHGLDVGDAAASARSLADVLDAMRGFLQRRL